MNILEIFKQLIESSGFMALTWQQAVMIGVSFIFLFLAIVKKFEPLLLLPIAFGMLLANLPEAGLMQPGPTLLESGVLYIIYQGVKSSVFPCLIFLGVGAMTDFGPLLANPSSLLLGGAAQLGIYVAFVISIATGLFTPAQAAAIGIIGGADGPTAIFLATRIASELLGPIAVAAYSYMALVPIVQPFAIRLVTTKKERRIRMPAKPARPVTKTTRILFPIIVTFLVGLISPASVSLVGFLMFGNLLRECGVLGNLSDTAQTSLANLITLLLGITISFSMRADAFVRIDTLMIMGIGLIAFIFDTIGGVLFAKFMNLFLKTKINPMIGAAGISAFPMSSRVVQKLAMEEEKGNIILMHAVGANVSGQIASVIAGGLVIKLVSQYL